MIANGEPRFLGFTSDGRARYACDYWLDHHGILRPPIAGAAPDTTNDQVDTGSDDGQQTAGSGQMIIDSLWAELYSDGAEQCIWVAVRFHNGPVPVKGSTVIAAYIEVNLETVAYDDIEADIHAQDAANPATLTGENFNITNRPLTSESVPWIEDGLGEGWVQSPSLVAVIQKLVDSYTPGAIMLVLKPRPDIYPVKHFEIHTQEYTDHTLGAKLHLEWTEGGAPQTLTPDPAVAQAAIPSPVLDTEYSLVPSPAVASAAVPSPALSLVTTLVPDPVVAPAAVPSPAVSLALMLAPTPVVAITAVPEPNIVVAGIITLQPTPVVAVVVVPSPALASSLTLSPTPVAAAAAVPSPALALVKTLLPTPVSALAVAPEPKIDLLILTLRPIPVVVAAVVPAPHLEVVGVYVYTPAYLLACIACWMIIAARDWPSAAPSSGFQAQPEYMPVPSSYVKKSGGTTLWDLEG